MTVDELARLTGGTVLSAGKPETEIKTGYCCDLLSHVMADAPESCAWVTVLTHLNTVAVAELANIGCIVIPEGIAVPEETVNKAAEENIPLISTELSSYEVSWRLHEALAEQAK